MSTYASDPYARGSGYTSDPYSHLPSAPAAKKKSGGLLGTLKHIATQTPADLVDIAYQIPGGLYEVHKALADADPSNLSHFGHSDTTKLKELGKAYVDSTVETFQHPLRHPGYTGLTVLPVVGAASRGAIGASTAARTGSVSAGAKAAVSSPPKALGPRELHVGGATSRGHYSRAATAALTQRGVDSFLQRAKPGTRRENLLHRRAAKWNERHLRVDEAVRRAPGTRARQGGKKLNDAQQRALRIVAEEVPLNRRIAALEQRLARSEGKTAQRHRKRLELTLAAAEYLEAGPDGKPRIRDDQPQLKAAYEATGRAAGDRGDIFTRNKVLEPEAQQAAKTKASRFAAGARWEEPTAAKLGISKPVERAEKRVDRLQKQHDRAAARRDAAAVKMLERLNREEKAAAKKPPPPAPTAAAPVAPKPLGPIVPGQIRAGTHQVDLDETPAAPVDTAKAAAEARLAELEKIHNKQLDKLRLALFGKADMADVRYRTRENKRAREQEAGVTKSGRRSGASTWKSKKRQSVVAEHRELAEKWAEENLDKMPPELREAWQRRTREMDELRKTVYPDPEDVFGPGPAKPAEKLDEAFDVHESGQTRLTTAGEQTNLIPLGDEAIPTEPVPGRTIDELAEATRAQPPAAPPPKPAPTPEPTPAPVAAKKKGVPAIQIGGKVVHEGGVLTPAGGAKAERLGSALSVAKDELEHARNRAAARVKPVGVVGAEDITVSEGAPFIGNPVERGRITGRPKVSSTSTFGHTRKPGSLKKATGGAVEKALERNDVTDIVAERHAEAVRIDTIRRRVELVKEAGEPTPLRKDDVWLWTDETVSSERIPPEVRRYLDSPEGISTLPEGQQQSIMDRVKAAYMERHNWAADDEARLAFEQLAEEGKGVFVPRRLLGDAGKMSPNVSAIPGVGVWDAVNNAQKALLVYLKLNYPLIQALSNTAMNIIQQGFAFPTNSAKAWRTYHAVGDETTAIVEDIMGAGAVVQANLVGTGAVSRASQVLGAKMSHFVDRPARLSAFYYEADKAGFGSPQALKALIEDDRYAPKLGEVAQRAKEAIVDYGEMGPTERQLIRRLLFVYPWQKGALKYSGHFLRDHPVQAAALGMVGARGQQISDETLGEVPGYLRGVFDTGDGRLVNPAGVNFFQTPAQIASAAGGYLTGNPVAPTGGEFLSPAPGLAVAEATRRDDFGRPLTGNVAENAEQVMVQDTPIYEALRSASGRGRSSDTFPNRNDALYRFLVGGLYPREYNRYALNQNAARQRAGR